MGTPLGQIDPTLNASYSMVGDILAAYENYFPGEFIHLGADEVLGDRRSQTVLVKDQRLSHAFLSP